MSSLLLVSGYQNVGHWRSEIATRLPDVDFVVWEQGESPDPVESADVTMIAIDTTPGENFFAQFPNLGCVQYLGHGVSDVVAQIDPDADIGVARLVDPGTTASMVEYCVGHVLREHLRINGYREQQAQADWTRIDAPRAADSRVGVLGLGGIGRAAIDAFRQLGFEVAGWSRSPREIDGVDCFHGFDTLAPLLGSLDHIVAILPETAETMGLFDAGLLAACQAGTHLLNVGRGSLIEPDALIAALNSGHLGAATLDVLPTEPLEPQSPLWTHPKITITPHMAGGGSPTSAIDTTVENYRRASQGAPLLHPWTPPTK